MHSLSYSRICKCRRNDRSKSHQEMLKLVNEKDQDIFIASDCLFINYLLMTTGYTIAPKYRNLQTPP